MIPHCCLTKQTVTTVSRNVMLCVEAFSKRHFGVFQSECQECFKPIVDILARCSRKSGYLITGVN